ncbi:MAG: hypothetical protein QM529_00805 [Hydrotalea sp.]|nr:hypothetical protein [Hydrotalea sp.]
MKKLLLTTAISLAILSSAKAETSLGLNLSLAPSFGVFSQKNASGIIDTLVLGGVDTSIGYRYNNLFVDLGVNALFGKGLPEKINFETDANVSKIAIYTRLGYRIKAAKKFSMIPSFLLGVAFDNEVVTAKEPFDGYGYDLPINGYVVTKYIDTVVGGGFEFSYDFSDSLAFSLDNKFMAYIKPSTGDQRIYDADGNEIKIDDVTGKFSSTLQHDPFVYAVSFKVGYTF